MPSQGGGGGGVEAVNVEEWRGGAGGGSCVGGDRVWEGCREGGNQLAIRFVGKGVDVIEGDLSLLVARAKGRRGYTVPRRATSGR